MARKYCVPLRVKPVGRPAYGVIVGSGTIWSVGPGIRSGRQALAWLLKAMMLGLLLQTALSSFAAAVTTDGVCPVQLTNDQTVHVRTPADVQSKRTQLLQFIWQQNSLPAGFGGLTVAGNVANPFGCGGINLAAVDRFNLAMGPAANGTSIRGWAWHFSPAIRKNRLVIVEHGHFDCSDFTVYEFGPAAIGVQMTVNALVAEGYDVLFVLMPLFAPDQCLQDHALLFQPDYAPPAGSPIRYFLDMTLQSLNYLTSLNTYSEVHMLGLSGGGWTTTLYAALDTRIARSFPIAGSIPLYLRGEPPATPLEHAAYLGAPTAASGNDCNNVGDAEQTLPGLYSIAGYPDLYVLGGYGSGREQVQILNRRDNCCFGQAEETDPSSYDRDVRTYEAAVRTAGAQSPSGGEFRLEVDEASVAHQISRNALYNVILADLEGARSKVGAASAVNAFKRGWNGRLWQSTGNGWTDIATHIVGVPSVVENAVYPVQMAARSAENTPLLASFDGIRWHSTALLSDDGAVSLPGGRIIGDPVAVSQEAGQLDVVAQGTDFGFYHWHMAGEQQTLERIGGGSHGVGLPALARSGADGLTVFYRSGDQINGVSGCLEQPTQLYGLDQAADGTWPPEQPLGIAVSAFPSASGTAPAEQLFVRGPGDAIWQYATQWTQVTPAASRFTGSPGRPVTTGARIELYARTDDNDLAHVEYRGQWRTTMLGLGAGSAQSVVGSPADTDDGVFWTGLDGVVRYYNAKGITVLSAEDTVFRDDLEGVLVP